MPNFKVEIKRTVGSLLQVASVVVVAKNARAAGDKVVARAEDGGYEGAFTPALDGPIGDQDFDVEIVNVERTDTAPTPYRDPDDADPVAGTGANGADPSAAGPGAAGGAPADLGQSQLPVDATNGPGDADTSNPPSDGPAPLTHAPGTQSALVPTLDVGSHVTRIDALYGTHEQVRKDAPASSDAAAAPEPLPTSAPELASPPGCGGIKPAMNNVQTDGLRTAATGVAGTTGSALGVNSAGAEKASPVDTANDVAIDQGNAPPAEGDDITRASA